MSAPVLPRDDGRRVEREPAGGCRSDLPAREQSHRAEAHLRSHRARLALEVTRLLQALRRGGHETAH